MPGGDRTGPEGKGPMTGRATGYCAGYPVPESVNPIAGRRFGFGQSRGGGRRGRRNMFYATGLTGWQQSDYNGAISDLKQQKAGLMDSEQEISMLREKSKELESNLIEINKRIRRIETNIGKAGLKAFVDVNKCEGCGRCVMKCDLHAISLVNDISQINVDLCNGCGKCVFKCKHEAISLRKN